MELIGYMDSPFVRRVAITLRFLDLGFTHRELSIFRDFDEFRKINPLVKVPTLLLDDGRVLVDSSLIIDFLESQVAKRSLMPAEPAAYRLACQTIGIALVAMEKSASLIYETGHRPRELQHEPWIDRLQTQLRGAIELLESAVSNGKKAGHTWLLDDELCQADITAAVAWRFTQHIECADVCAGDYPALSDFSARAEALTEFKACPLSG